ncbi:MAG: hypothetical protein KBH06_00925 [Spirochaetes bacterium]|nr:hypothetical protein [Spirochaetota bacterium]
MKFIKRTILAILILTAVILLFRGWIYRNLITYKSVGPAINYRATDNKLIGYINANAGKQANPNIEQIIKLALVITSKQLNFTVEKNNSDPNKLIVTKTAHCVGYAAFFSTTCNYLLNNYHLANTWTAKPQVGQLYLFGQNIHKYFHSPFFKNHNFVTIENKTTGKIYAVDPTVNDYLYIDYVKYKH